jgi:hypothetical protein
MGRPNEAARIRAAAVQAARRKTCTSYRKLLEVGSFAPTHSLTGRCREFHHAKQAQAAAFSEATARFAALRLAERYAADGALLASEVKANLKEAAVPRGAKPGDGRMKNAIVAPMLALVTVSNSVIDVGRLRLPIT